MFQPTQEVPGSPQQCVAPLLLLEGVCGHLRGSWFWGALAPQDCHHTWLEPGHPDNALMENLVKMCVVRVQFILLVFQEILQCLSHKEEATLHSVFWRSGVQWRAEDREAWRPAWKVFPIGIIKADQGIRDLLPGHSGQPLGLADYNSGL